MDEVTQFIEKETDILEKTQKGIKAEQHEIDTIIRELKGIYSNIRSKGKASFLVSGLTDVIRKAREREILIIQKHEYIQTIYHKLSTFDVSMFPELHKGINVASVEERKQFQEYVYNEHARIFGKYDIASQISLSGQFGAEFMQAIENTLIYIAREDVKASLSWIKKAILLDKKIVNILQRILSFEDSLIKITKGNLKSFQKAS